MPGQVRSGHQSGFVDTTTEKFAIMSELEFFFHEAVSSLNPRPAGEAESALLDFLNNSKTVADIDTKLCVPYPTSI